MGLLLTAALVLLALVALLVVRVFVVPRYKYAWADKIPGPPRHWLYGTLHHSKPGRDNLLKHYEFSQTYGPVSRMWVGPLFPLIVCYHPSSVQHILRESQPKGSFYRYLDTWLGWSLLTSSGADWKRKRRMITPAFHFQVLKGFQPIFASKLEELFVKWDRLAEEHAVVDVCTDITHTTLDIIGLCAFAYDIGALKSGRRVAYVNAIYSAMQLVYERTFSALHTMDWFYDNFSAKGKEYKQQLDVLHTFVTKVINGRKEELERQMAEEGVESVAELIEESGKKPCFIDILFSSTDADGKPLSLQEIRDETNTFMFEGHDTTSSGLAFSLYFLAKHPEVQQKSYEEVSAVLGSSVVPELAMLNNMPYTKACIEESLRVAPPVPVVSRTLPEAMNIEGYDIPKGANVMVHPYIVHHQPDVWEDPHKFDPERFSVEGKRKQGAFDYIPFSAGPRNCVGQKFAMQEELTILSAIVNRYRIELVPSDEEYELWPALVSRPLGSKSKEPYNIYLYRR